MSPDEQCQRASRGSSASCRIRNHAVSHGKDPKDNAPPQGRLDHQRPQKLVGVADYKKQLRASIIVLVYVRQAEGRWQCSSGTFPSIPSDTVLDPCSPKRRSLFTCNRKRFASSRIVSRGPPKGGDPMVAR